MSIDISPDTQNRLIARAHAEGMSLDALLARMIDEREELENAIQRAELNAIPPSQEELRDNIERGFQQSESGEVVDGETFTAGLIHEIDDLEQKRRAG